MNVILRGLWETSGNAVTLTEKDSATDLERPEIKHQEP